MKNVWYVEWEDLSGVFATKKQAIKYVKKEQKRLDCKFTPTDGDFEDDDLVEIGVNYNSEEDSFDYDDIISIISVPFYDAATEV